MSVRACVCLRTGKWHSVVLETPTVAETTTEVVLSTSAGVYVSVLVWTDFVTAVVSQLYGHKTRELLRSK